MGTGDKDGWLEEHTALLRHISAFENQIWDSLEGSQRSFLRRGHVAADKSSQSDTLGRVSIVLAPGGKTLQGVTGAYCALAPQACMT